jgi:drug/metabolite transporter (DMT)-like permease
VGALLLFGAVQVTMIATGLARGERPLARDWAGMLLAAAGLGWLTLAGASAPDLTGAALMVIAGASWGAYSIMGRRSRDPLAATAGNFWRAAILGIVALGLLHDPHALTGPASCSPRRPGPLRRGLAIRSGTRALHHLTAWRAALVQLAVP